MATQTITHTCGHTSEVDGVLLGRGTSRQERIVKLETTLCRDCEIARLRKYAAKLTTINGTPYTAEQQAAYVAKRMPK